MRVKVKRSWIHGSLAVHLIMGGWVGVDRVRGSFSILMKDYCNLIAFHTHCC